MRVIYTKKECRKDRSARNTIGARYLPKNTVILGICHKTGSIILAHQKWQEFFLLQAEN
jgi:hypothetical protein